MPVSREDWLAIPRSKRPYEDGTDELIYTVNKKHCFRAQSKSKEFCVQAHAINDLVGVLWCHVYLDRVYVQFENESYPKRYQLSTRARKLAIINDSLGAKGLIERFSPAETLSLGLMPPRFAISKRRLRSEEFKKKRTESYIKNKNKKVRRKYTKPEALGLRSGIGQA